MAAFKNGKSDYQARRRIVSTLVRDARLFQPEARVGTVVEALWKAGVFRMRACLVGTIAYQTYGTVLGYRLAGRSLMTADIDLAQFHSISAAVADSTPPILSALQSADQAFRPIPQLNDRAGPSRFQGSDGLRVDILTPNRGSDDISGQPVSMPTLGGAAAEPLRFLDFLIHEPVRTVLLYKAGIPVLVPDPARYAIHKLIVAHRRERGTGKDLKDLEQAENLAVALTTVARNDDLLAAHHEAMERGPAWREAITASLGRLKALGLKGMATAIPVA